jgi:SAM-dependent methyltransferase
VRSDAATSRTVIEQPDAIFAEPRLAEIYDALDADRSDLEAYAALVEELGAHAVLDIGCGTGTFACLLAQRGKAVVAVDPAAASLDVARRKPGAEGVRWIHGAAETLPPLQVDLALMTGNVAQVFVTDEAWRSALRAVRVALRPGGHFVFETRDAAKRAWERWPADSRRPLDLPGVGRVETWCELTAVDLPLVSFRHHFAFQTDGATVVSDSTLRFRERDELASDLEAAGFRVAEMRDAPDRPGLEFVFIAQRADDHE